MRPASTPVEREVHRYRDQDRDRLAVQAGGRVLPLAHRVYRRLIQGRNRTEHLRGHHVTASIDGVTSTALFHLRNWSPAQAMYLYQSGPAFPFELQDSIFCDGYE